MIRASRFVLVGILSVAGGLFTVGCASSHMSGENSAVVCDKCGTTTRTPYTVPSYEGRRQVGYMNTTAPECESCRQAQQTFASTGKLAEAGCKTCGGTMKVETK